MIQAYSNLIAHPDATNGEGLINPSPYRRYAISLEPPQKI
jgi:hypothetical protein